MLALMMRMMPSAASSHADAERARRRRARSRRAPSAHRAASRRRADVGGNAPQHEVGVGHGRPLRRRGRSRPGPGRRRRSPARPCRLPMSVTRASEPPPAPIVMDVDDRQRRAETARSRLRLSWPAAPSRISETSAEVPPMSMVIGVVEAGRAAPTKLAPITPAAGPDSAMLIGPAGPPGAGRTRRRSTS